MLIVTCVAFFRALYTAAARKAKENGHLPATASGVDKSACWARFRTQAPAARAKTARPAQRIHKGMNGSSPACPAPFPPHTFPCKEPRHESPRHPAILRQEQSRTLRHPPRCGAGRRAQRYRRHPLRRPDVRKAGRLRRPDRGRGPRRCHGAGRRAPSAGHRQVRRGPGQYRPCRLRGPRHQGLPHRGRQQRGRGRLRPGPHAGRGPQGGPHRPPLP